MSRAGGVRVPHYEWRKNRPWDLASYVVPHAHRWLGEPNPFANANDDHTSPEGREGLARKIFEHLLGLRIAYDLEPYDRNPYRQRVRSVHEVLRPGGQGTCLDLTLAYCGLCEGADLIPCVLLLEGHALAGVWMGHRMRDWDHRERKKWNARFRAGAPPSEIGPVTESVAGGFLLPVECTGFARTRALPAGYPEACGRDAEGFFDFERAVAAGREQIERAASGSGRGFLLAIDLAVARHDERHLYEPQDIGEPPARVAATPAPRRRAVGVWPFVVDRGEQVADLWTALPRAEGARRPLVCLVVGAVDDEHHGLVRRVVDYELGTRRGPGAVDLFVDFPRLDWDESGGDFDAAYLRSLDKKLPRGCRTIEDVAGFFRGEPRRWLLASQVELAPGDARAGCAVVALARFWERVGQAMADAPADRMPLAWLQVVPGAPASSPWWRFRPAPPDPKARLHRELAESSGTRCFRPLPLVGKTDIDAWRQTLHDEAARDPRWGHLDEVDPTSRMAELYPNDATKLPMARVRPWLEGLIEQSLRGRDR
ncbi:MAG TPA: hypothetical protein VF590_08765 [Isosphaeraceae bacterium]|jgi:hypothetical protein